MIVSFLSYLTNELKKVGLGSSGLSRLGGGFGGLGGLTALAGLFNQ